MDSPRSKQTTLLAWSAPTRAFAVWQLRGLALTPNGAVRLDPASAELSHDQYPPGSYRGRNYYNGGTFLFGEALSPSLPLDPAVTELVPSWNADMPPGSWLELQVRLQANETWSGWYSFGVWAPDSGTVARHSVPDQRDEQARVAVDVLALKSPAQAFQLRLHLYSVSPAALPEVRLLTVACSPAYAPPATLEPGDPALWNTVLNVPQCSQMVYPDGGNVWCSPTTIAMLLGYWQGRGSCSQRVHHAVAGVYDWCYDGHGNWPFNTAYAASQGMVAYLTRFASLRQAERWIAAGVPLALSYAWSDGALTGAPIASSNGHIVALVGFDAAGNPEVNDPAAPSDEQVQRVYNRNELETLWLAHSGGLVYIVYPPGYAVPEDAI